MIYLLLGEIAALKAGKDGLQRKLRPARVQNLVEEVCRLRGLDPLLIDSLLKRRPIAQARHEIWWELRHRPTNGDKRASFPLIASWFGMDHTTVIDGVRRHRDWRKSKGLPSSKQLSAAA